MLSKHLGYGMKEPDKGRGSGTGGSEGKLIREYQWLWRGGEERRVQELMNDKTLHDAAEIGVMDIGRKSTVAIGLETLGIGEIHARFHWGGTNEEERERLNRWAIGLQKMGAESRRNQAGMESRPVEVGGSLSSMRKIVSSETNWLKGEQEDFIWCFFAFITQKWMCVCVCVCVCVCDVCLLYCML